VDGHQIDITAPGSVECLTRPLSDDLYIYAGYVLVHVFELIEETGIVEARGRCYPKHIRVCSLLR
jgi:hypothetical protein